MAGESLSKFHLTAPAKILKKKKKAYLYLIKVCRMKSYVNRCSTGTEVESYNDDSTCRNVSGDTESLEYVNKYKATSFRDSFRSCN